ncbi:MAG: ABC transporter ATP-binding protein [Baekduia sp.]
MATIIEAQEVRKAFHVPDRPVDSFRELALRPLASRSGRTLHALDGVTFSVEDGEFFGIVGQNGSGKSTLLKILASIYRADSGVVRTGGRIAPFIELGVGFNPDLTARENNEMNGVLMGLTRRAARRRLDAVLDFAELQDFRELKLKNYSSGMMVRLAFAIMVQAEADIMLIDEVLAVGDAAFAAKCMEVFRERRRRGQTVVLVTHDMGAVQSLCHRAMMLDHGRMKHIGDVEAAAREYFRANYTGYSDGQAGEAFPDINVRVVSFELRDAAGDAIENVEQGTPLRFHATFEARRRMRVPTVGLHVRNADNLDIFTVHRELSGDLAELEAGDRFRVAGELDNPLLPGRYGLDCWIRDEEGGATHLQVVRLADFHVYGSGGGPGIVTVPSVVEIGREP